MAEKTAEDRLIAAALALRDRVASLHFAPPVAYVYNPLEYAWAPHERYLRSYGAGHKRVIFMGMNPGPFGMAQTGIPFGEIDAVRDWLGIEAPVSHPPCEHPKRPVTGFACTRSEVSGRRLWGFFRKEYGTPNAFFADHFVVNYCPLVFMDESGRNLTPDKLPKPERAALQDACDEHLRAVIDILQPQWAIGIGGFARDRLRELLADSASKAEINIGMIPHPSPASPSANRDWDGPVRAVLVEHGLL
ncbi:MAG: single-stranded DNA-binding protein [Chromatiales bacterium]|nr:single-stranded DNA-binding protein [Chromatiales bacterium]